MFHLSFGGVVRFEADRAILLFLVIFEEDLRRLIRSFLGTTWTIYEEVCRLKREDFAKVGFDLIELALVKFLDEPLCCGD